MEILMAAVTGAIFGAGLYLMVRRSLVRLIFGLILMGHAANLAIFTVGGLVRDRAPVIPQGSDGISGAFADPLPQALILTAIVIGFGVQAFAIVLLERAARAAGTDDLDRMTTTDRT